NLHRAAQRPAVDDRDSRTARAQQLRQIVAFDIGGNEREARVIFDQRGQPAAQQILEIADCDCDWSDSLHRLAGDIVARNGCDRVRPCYPLSPPLPHPETTGTGESRVGTERDDTGTRTEQALAGTYAEPVVKLGQ